MDSQLAIQSQAIQINSLADMAELAVKIHNSKLAPNDLGSPDAVLVAMQHGMELGLSPMQAVQAVAVINKRPVIWGDAALALVKAHPTVLDVVETWEKGETDDKKLARCIIKLRDREPVERCFTVDDAKRAGLWEKAGPWKQYPKRMLQMRARSWAMRDACPQALKGVSVREEMQDVEPRQSVSLPKLVLPGTEPPAVAALPAPAEPSDNDLEHMPEKPW